MNGEFLNKLKSISSTKDKINALTFMMCEDENIARFFNMCLDPLKNYGIKVLPDLSEPDGKWSDCSFRPDDEIFEDCEHLSKMNHSNESIDLVKYILTHTMTPEIFGKLILKNPDCGISISNFNKALPTKLKAKYEIKDYPCMLVSSDFAKFNAKYGEEYAKGNIIVQQKMDGARINIIVHRDGSVKYYGRSGKEMHINSESIANEFRALKSYLDSEMSLLETPLSNDWVFDGEVLAYRDGRELDRKTGNGIINKTVRGTASVEEVDTLHFILWDVILWHEMFDNKDDLAIPMQYRERYTLLRDAIAGECFNCILEHVDLVQAWHVDSIEKAEYYFREMLKHGNEGIIVKHLDNVWANKRVTDMCKLKDIQTADLRVIGFEYGTGKYEGMLGALQCESSDGLLQVSVGTGFSDAQRQQYVKEDIVGRVVEIQYNAKIEDKNRSGIYSLFLPRFVCFRDDKEVANSNKEIM